MQKGMTKIWTFVYSNVIFKRKLSSNGWIHLLRWTIDSTSFHFRSQRVANSPWIIQSQHWHWTNTWTQISTPSVLLGTGHHERGRFEFPTTVRKLELVNFARGCLLVTWLSLIRMHFLHPMKLYNHLEHVYPISK